MPSCNTYRLTWVSLTSDVGYLHGCFSKAQPLLLTLDEGYLLTATPPDLERGVVGINHRGFNPLPLSLLKWFPLFIWLLFAGLFSV